MRLKTTTNDDHIIKLNETHYHIVQLTGFIPVAQSLIRVQNW